MMIKYPNSQSLLHMNMTRLTRIKHRDKRVTVSLEIIVTRDEAHVFTLFLDIEEIERITKTAKIT